MSKEGKEDDFDFLFDGFLSIFMLDYTVLNEVASEE